MRFTLAAFANTHVSSAQTAYAVHFDNHKMKVISADFTPIVPYETDVLYIQGGQRYNVIVEANQVSIQRGRHSKVSFSNVHTA